LSAEIYLGGYGGFDSFAYTCCKKYQSTHRNITIWFITPYITESYQKNRLEHYSRMYDGIIYPEIENKPLKFAITYRNRWMVEKSDYVIAYVDHAFGGAYKTYRYAKTKGKRIINLASLI
jgi:uncharacterized phage-like protein YoqJ